MDGQDWFVLILVAACVSILGILLVAEKMNEDEWAKLSAEDVALEAFTHDTYYQNAGDHTTLRHTPFTKIDREYVSTYTFNTTKDQASAVVTVKIERGTFRDYNKTALILYPDVGNAALIN